MKLKYLELITAFFVVRKFAEKFRNKRISKELDLKEGRRVGLVAAEKQEKRFF